MQTPMPENASGALAWYRTVLVLAALYDGLLGLAFLFFSGPLFNWLGIASAVEPVYIHLAAGLIAIMGFGFWLASRHPKRNQDIVLMGAVFKLFYVALAVYALITGQVPHPLFLLFAAIDFAFLLVFLAFLRTVRDIADSSGLAGPRRSGP